MKCKSLFLAILFAFVFIISYGATDTISNNVFVFTPDEITVNTGDTIIFSIGGSHNAIEVSEETWNSNGNVANGGFSVPFGGGEVIFEEEGTYYYVCEPHASLGMKGIINVVSTVTSDEEILAEKTDDFSIYPNPVKQVMGVSFFVPEYDEASIELIDITGRVVQVLAEKKTYAPGRYEEYFDLGHLEKGKYFVFYSSGSTQTVRSVILIY